GGGVTGPIVPCRGRTQRSVRPSAGAMLTASAAVVALALAGCAAGQAAPAVPSLGAGTAGAPTRARALHLAGQCIRQHGIPAFPDPMLNSAGQVTFNKSQPERLRLGPPSFVVLAARN